MNAPRLIEREVPPRTAWALEQAGVAPLLARLLAARGVRAGAIGDAQARAEVVGIGHAIENQQQGRHVRRQCVEPVVE